jgi:hypothetical protein
MVFQTVPLHISVEMSDYRDEGGTFREARSQPQSHEAQSGKQKGGPHVNPSACIS